MTTPAQDAPLVLPSVVFRPIRLFVICTALTAAAIVAADQFGQPMLGVFFGLGLALGLVNALLVRRSVQSITANAHPLKSKMALNSATRLLIITIIGLVIAYLFRPPGLGVLLGLALFEVLLVATTALPVVKKLRNSATAGSGALDGTEGTARER
ncbi:MAG TPA: ATP synthase subunit I [Mycobacterium sp.]|nr:ATP synthase subunit I [Mycobacterium sp.]